MKGERPSNVKCLFVMRSDYIGLAQASPWDELLPPMREGIDWREISAFRERDARTFLESSGLDIGPKLMDRIFDQIAEFEGTAGLVRPITVNMVGMALDSTAISIARMPAASHRGGGLLVEFVQQSISKSELGQHAPILLSQMLEKGGFRKPRSINELVASTGLKSSVIKGVLLQLLQSGIVRIVDAQEEIWEISHDFVARILDRVLRDWRTGLWRRAQEIALPAAVILWAGIFLALPWIAKNIEDVRMSDITAELTFESSDPGSQCPPVLNVTRLKVIGSARYVGEPPKKFWDDALGPKPDLTVEAQGNPPVIDRGGETAEETCLHRIQFNRFSGELGAFRRPDRWKGAWLEANIEAQANDKDWNSFIEDSEVLNDSEGLNDEFRKTYHLTKEDNFGKSTGVTEHLSVFVNGKQVASAEGIVAITSTGYHNMPLVYYIKFLPFRSSALDSGAGDKPSKSK